MVHDLLYRGSLSGLRVGFSYCVTTELVNEAVLRHNCDPLSAHLLGRAVSAGVLLSATLDQHERVNVRWKYDGEVRTVLVDSGADGTTRGFISPTNLSDYSDNVDSLFGEQAEMSVIRSAAGRIVNSGTAQSILCDVVRDLTYFLAISDQVETAMTILIAFNQDDEQPVRLCRGLMLQAMPDTDMTMFEQLRMALEQDAARQLLAHETEPDGLLENVINVLLQNETNGAVEYEAAQPPRFQCTCNREKMVTVLQALPQEDRDDIVQKKEDVKINCQFCNERYVLSIEECVEVWEGS